MQSIKCVVVGDGGVGKSSLLIALTEHRFMEDYQPTVFDNYTTIFPLNDSMSVILELWDTAGQEEYDRLRPLSYATTDVFVIVFSMVNKHTLENVLKKWAPEVAKYCPKVPVVLAGTKCDLVADERRQEGNWVVNPETAADAAKKIGAKAWFACSALTQKNVYQVFAAAVRAVIEPVLKRKRQKCLLL